MIAKGLSYLESQRLDKLNHPLETAHVVRIEHEQDGPQVDTNYLVELFAVNFPNYGPGDEAE